MSSAIQERMSPGAAVSRVRIDPRPLVTDLYQLTMLNAYHQLGMDRTAVFELYVRRLPETRNFLVAAGLEQVLEFLENLRFDDAEISWLASTRLFASEFLESLATLRFTGDVYAMAEGTVFFSEEPLIRVTAPLPQAQLVESRVINDLHFQTVVASKAARCRLAAGTKRLIDFGMRRAHGLDAAVLASRASYVAGFDGTATVEAGRLFGIPISGTMAHSFVQAHEHELEAFRGFARCNPENTTLLIDTYDTERGAEHAVTVARELAGRGIRVQAVRIDSGELGDEARRVRAILDAGGFRDVRIFASGGLDEHSIDSLLRRGAPIDGFGVGTRLDASSDAPTLDCAYKLQEYAGTPRRKRSPWKENWPGRRQVHRQYDQHGRIAMDVVGCADELIEGKALLHPVMLHGRRLADAPSLDAIRQHATTELETLPMGLRSLEHGPHAPVRISHGLRSLASELDQRRH
ncbi:MAG TPA: nicotinate phosphoribosyltransferase [Steroidobacteraceae bacterium]|nr:nicotinate phosphoribosyltransferase [Steroidobacteraceae bacterium]